MCHKKENINAVCCWTPFLASFRLTQLNGEKIGKVEMLVLHQKRCSTATNTISGGADVVKPITSHDIQYEGTSITVILLAKSLGIQLNDAQSNGKP